MSLLFNLILITTIWCLGIKIITAEGMALEKLGEWAQKKVDDGNKIYEPLLTCHFCLPSIHSFIGYGFAVGIGVINVFEWRLVFMWPLVVIGSSILCGSVWEGMQIIIHRSQFFKNINNIE